MLILIGLAAQLAVTAPATPTPLVPLPPAPLDTPTPSTRQRPRAVEVSEWYNRRLTIHRALSYTTPALFAFQYAAGDQLYDKGSAAPRWARDGHPIGAATIATVFTVNTITGVWNLWDSRSVEQGRTLRYVHAISMLAADAGFTWAGAYLSKDAHDDPEKRSCTGGSR